MPSDPLWINASGGSPAYDAAELRRAFGLLLPQAVGDRFGPSTRITSVESDERATEHAAENLADWLGAQVQTARVERWVRSLADASATERARLSAATVVLDPPRSGAGRAVLEALAAVRPAQLVKEPRGAQLMVRAVKQGAQNRVQVVRHHDNLEQLDKQRIGLAKARQYRGACRWLKVVSGPGCDREKV